MLIKMVLLRKHLIWQMKIQRTSRDKSFPLDNIKQMICLESVLQAQLEINNQTRHIFHKFKKKMETMSVPEFQHTVTMMVLKQIASFLTKWNVISFYILTEMDLMLMTKEKEIKLMMRRTLRYLIFQKCNLHLVEQKLSIFCFLYSILAQTMIMEQFQPHQMNFKRTWT